MKRLLVLLFIVTSFQVISHAQSAKDVPMPKSYLFDKFINGSVLSKSGAVDEAPLNYNAEDQTIIFYKDGQHFILTNLENIDTIYIKDRKFIPVNNVIYEVLASSSPVSLLVSYHSKTRPMTAISNHDSTTKKVSNQVSNTVTDVYVTRPFNGDNDVEILSRYWLNRGTSVYKANTEKQFVKVFSSNETVIKNYIKDSSIDFNKTSDLMKLVAFSNRVARAAP
ncbi:MAG: hypothetical protein ABUT20_15380 [Bacteroidota bacterium]